MTRNRAFSETELLNDVIELLRSTLPASWDIAVELEPRLGTAEARRADAVVRVRSPEGTTATIIVEMKSRLDPRDVPTVVLQVRPFGGDAAVVVAPYLSPRTQQRLIEWNTGYADGTGNLRLALDRPAVFVERVGASINPSPENRPLRSLKGPAAARIVRALCDYRPPVGIRELAKRSRASAASVARVVGLLDREALIEREPGGGVVTVHWRETIRQWSKDYSFVDSNRVQPLLEPRGLRALVGKLQVAEWRYAVTGSLAAAQVAPVAAPRLAAVYVEGIREAAGRLGLRPAESGGNVLLVEPFDPALFDRSWQREGVGYAALSQVAADLLTSPGRGPAEGEDLMSWMERNEDAWRVRSGL